MRTNQGLGEQKRLSLASRARRDQILQAAAEVVAEVGYANASTARIAERAGISKGVITYHFDSKDEIMRLIALRLFGRCSDEVNRCISAVTTESEQVHAWIRGELEFFATHRTESIAMTDIMANHRDPDFFRAFDHEVADETRRLAAILVRGQQQSEFRAFDAESVAHIILRCKDGVLDSLTHNPDHDVNEHIETLLDFIDHAITKRIDRTDSGMGSVDEGSC